jgi:aminoglycoside 2''-phosphotransferase
MNHADDAGYGTAAYLAIIQDAYPGLRIVFATLNQQGQNNDVLVAQCPGTGAHAPGDLVFRFPRHRHVLAQLRAETAVLSTIQSRLPLPVAVPSFVALEGREVGNAFVGHWMLPGEPLWPQILEGLSEAVVDRLAGELGGFLRALHAVPGDAVPVELPLTETQPAVEGFYSRVRANLFAHMRPEARARVAELFDRYLDQARHFAYTPVLRHGDFGASNILVDDTSQQVTGILDFNGVAWGDPAYDAAGLLASYGDAFLERCAITYGEIRGFLERVRFYRRTFALEEALFGVEHGDEAAFRAGIAGYT